MRRGSRIGGSLVSGALLASCASGDGAQEMPLSDPVPIEEFCANGLTYIQEQVGSLNRFEPTASRVTQASVGSLGVLCLASSGSEQLTFGLELRQGEPGDGYVAEEGDRHFLLSRVLEPLYGNTASAETPDYIAVPAGYADGFLAQICEQGVPHVVITGQTDVRRVDEEIEYGVQALDCYLGNVS